MIWNREEGMYDVMTLIQPVTWSVGDQIAIAYTGHRHIQHEDEFLTVTGE